MLPIRNAPVQPQLSPDISHFQVCFGLISTRNKHRWRGTPITFHAAGSNGKRHAYPVAKE
jgi:hypothetical protein